MATTQATTQERTAREPIAQTQTHHTVLGFDAEGYHHVYDESRDRVVVLNATGIDHQQSLDDRPVQAWLDYVAEERGWQRVQYLTATSVFGGL